ncbi:hypothetical protein ACHAP9_004569 [Verticillium nonalfalfae]
MDNSDPNLTLHYDAPAASWSEALPVGNGRLGGMVYGRTFTELLQLNEDSVWYGGPQDRTPRDARRHLDTLRQLIRDEEHAAAEALVREAFFATPASMRHSEPLGNCTLEFGHEAQDVTGYRRSLDLATAQATVEYQCRGVSYRRETIASFPDNVVALRFSASEPTRFVVRLNRVSEIEWETNEFLDSIQAANGRIVLNATPGGKNSNPLSLVLGISCDASDEGGSIEAVGNALVVKAFSCTLVIAAHTAFRNADPEAAARQDVDNALKQSWHELVLRQRTDYASLFQRLSLRMWPAAHDLPTNERIEKNRDPGLVALYYNYGRYLLISSSRDSDKALPATLQGIWNPSFAPPWGCKYTININLQMNYWLAAPGNLVECALPMLGLVERMAVRGAKTARTMYDCGGWCAHHNTDIWADTDPQDRWMPSTIWPLGGVWLCIDVLEMLLYHYDRKLHERAAVLLEGCIVFLLDFLIPSACGTFLVTNPSLSPENTFVSKSGDTGILCEGSAIDTTIVRIAFEKFLWSTAILEKGNPLVPKVRDAMARLPDLTINNDGLIQEWGLKDYKEHEPGHRHVSHLFGLYPGESISPVTSPKLAAAAKNVLDRRAAHGGGHTGWSRAWLLNLHARLHDADGYMFRQDLETIDSLRRNAVNVRDPHPSGIKELQTYAGQLMWIGGKFPIDIGAEFTWYPALGYNTERPVVRNNLKYELLNILYNLAALYSQLAVAQTNSGPEGVKKAVPYFNLAAGVLSYMQKEVLPELRMSDPPEDMDTHTLEALIQLLLAQSQECFWKKAVMDGTYKDAIIARLAARVSDLYSTAGDAAMKSEAISSSWIHHMSAKHHHFAGAAQYRAACDCLEKKKYGEEVARLTDAVQCVNEGLKEARGGYVSKTIIEDLNGLKRKVEEDLKRAEKDNDLIYMDPVPPKPELKLLDRADMAKITVPPQVANPFDYFGDQAEFGPALFSKLVPFAVHAAITIYEQRRDRLVNQSIIQNLEDLTERLHTMLSSINLPGSLQALEKPLGLPPSLVQHAEEIRQADAIGRIQRAFSDIDKLRSADIAVFDEGKSMLAAEEEEDARRRAKFGTDRWTRPDSRSDPRGAQLWAQVAEIDGYFASSTSSDEVVRDKFGQAQDLLELLSAPDRVLMDYVPSSRRMDIAEPLKPVIGRLRGAYNDVLRLESRRRKKVEALRDKCRNDDIKPEILKEAARLERTYPTTAIAPAHFEDFFERRLDKLYEPELEGVEKEDAEQERMMTEIERVNREFESQRKSSIGGNREREQALQRLDNAYYKYKEIVNHLDVGRKFYNDLSKVVGQNFRDPVKVWVSERRIDAKSLEEELSMPPLGSLSMNRTPVASPPVSSYQAEQQQHANSYFGSNAGPAANTHAQRPHQQVHSPPAEAHVQSWAGSTVEPQQPQPVPPVSNMWTPDMGIRFGGPAGGHGAAAPAAHPPGPRQASGGTWDPNSGIRFG